VSHNDRRTHLDVFENRMPRITLEHKGEEAKEDWGQWYKREFHNLYFSSSIVTVSNLTL
jgi:hypothetical protein